MATKFSTKAIGAILLVSLAGCSGGPNLGRLNPMTWFGADEAAQEETPAVEEEVIPGPSDGRLLVAGVTRARLEPTRFGAILQAEGLMDYPLVALPDLRAARGGASDENGVLYFDMVGNRLGSQDKAFSLNVAIFGEERGETSVDSSLVPVTAATYISGRTLRGVSAVVVSSQDGAVTVPVR